MTICEAAELISAQIRTCPERADRELSTAFAGDMLSDALSLSRQPDILLTGLVNPQVIRTAEMLDTTCVVFLKGKMPSDSVLQLASDRGICILTAENGMFSVCGTLYAAGIAPVE